MERINVILINLPYNIQATHTVNPDNSYSVFINCRLGYYQQRTAYLHELKHIKNRDIFKESAADTLEVETRREI